MASAEKTRFGYLLTIGIAVVAALLIILTVHFFTREVVEVRTAPVTYQNLVSSVSTNGKVEPVSEFQAHAFGPGQVEKVYVTVGQKVRAGQLLIRLNDGDAVARLASAKASLSSAEATAQDARQNGSQEERISFAGELSRAQLQQQQAQRNLATLEELQQKGAASAGEVAAAEQRLQSANSTLRGIQQRSSSRYSHADLARTEAQVADAQAAVHAAEAGYSYSNIHSPINGTAYSIPVNAYDFVSMGEDLMNVADLNHIQVRSYFDEPEIGKLSKGQAVKIVWDAKPGQVWHGHVERAPTTVITYGTRNVGECIITVDDAHGDLLPNTNVTVTVTTAQRFNVLSVPREALRTDGAVNFVYRVVNGKLVRTLVQIGTLNLTRVEIVGGLNEKDTVALNATSNRELSNGLAVKSVE